MVEASKLCNDKVDIIAGFNKKLSEGVARFSDASPFRLYLVRPSGGHGGALLIVHPGIIIFFILPETE